VDGSTTNDVKSLFSSQEILSSVSLITTGVIPSIKASSVKLAIKEFSNFDPAEMSQKVAALHNTNQDNHRTMDSSTEAARKGQAMTAFEKSKVESVIASVAEVDKGSNKMLDIDTLMTAFEDYIAKIADSNSGVPLTYHVKKISRYNLARLWKDKYFPGEFLTAGGEKGGEKS